MLGRGTTLTQRHKQMQGRLHGASCSPRKGTLGRVLNRLHSYLAGLARYLEEQTEGEMGKREEKCVAATHMANSRCGPG